MASEGEDAAHEGADVVGALVADLFDVARERFALKPVEFGFGIEQVHLAGASVLEEMDDGLGFGRKMRLFRREIERVRLSGVELISSEKMGQGSSADSVRHAIEEATAG